MFVKKVDLGGHQWAFLRFQFFCKVAAEVEIQGKVRLAGGYRIIWKYSLSYVSCRCCGLVLSYMSLKKDASIGVRHFSLFKTITGRYHFYVMSPCSSLMSLLSAVAVECISYGEKSQEKKSSKCHSKPWNYCHFQHIKYVFVIKSKWCIHSDIFSLFLKNTVPGLLQN